MSQRPLESGSKTRGIGVYTRELSKALIKYFPRDQIMLKSDDYYAGKPDIVHFPYFDPFFLTLPIRGSVPTIITIHDLIPLKFEAHFPRGFRGQIKWLIQRQKVRLASHIITDSDSSKQDIVDILSIMPEKISVIPLAPKTDKVPAQLAKKIATKLNLPEKYLLYVGDINWNKNVPGLINAFARIADPKLHLVLAGHALGENTPIPEKLAVEGAIAASGKQEKIHLLGFVASHHLPVLYNYATLYVQPSWYEGFGLTVLEAMQYGAPVASSNRGSLKEIGGDAVVYFDPAKNMTETITEVLHSVSRRNLMRERGLAYVETFTWEQVAKETHKVYEQVLAK